jgi:hypothetical protein
VEAQEEHGGPFVVDMPDVFKQALVMEKDSKRFPKSGGWIRGVQLRSRIGQFHGRSQPVGLRKHVPHGCEGEGLHLSPVPEALNGVRRTSITPRGAAHGSAALYRPGWGLRQARSSVTSNASFGALKQIDCVF